jgi:uncharacterized protein (TIGR02246 family)
MNQDEKAINAQIESWIDKWNRHDYSDLSSYTTDDVVFVNPVGMLWKGRKEFQHAMETFHSTILQDADYKKISADIRFITNDVAIVHLITHTGPYKSPDNKDIGNNDNAGTYVFVKRDGMWLLTAGAEVAVDAAAAQFNPVNNMRR